MKLIKEIKEYFAFTHIVINALIFFYIIFLVICIKNIDEFYSDPAGTWFIYWITELRVSFLLKSWVIPLYVCLNFLTPFILKYDRIKVFIVIVLSVLIFITYGCYSDVIMPW